LDIFWENKPANFARVRTLVESAQPEAGDLLVLPEMFSTGFTMNVAAASEAENPGAEEFVRSLARERGIFVIAGVVTAAAEPGKGLNQAIAVNPDGAVAARYSKIHPFSLGGETKHYAHGTEIRLFDWNGLKVAPFVCYDLRFPEIFRAAVRQGAEMFAVIANWPARRAQHWVTLLQARAIENLAYVAGVNRAGNDPKLSYPGRSLIVDPHGKVVADAGEAERVVSAEVDRRVMEDWRRDFPALRDMHWGLQ
jgi:predicted amidohydrolase